MKRPNLDRLLAGAALALAVSVGAHAAPTTEDEALHVLNRLAYGPAPGDVARVEAMGIDRYIDEQLHPERIPLPPTLTAALNALPTASLSEGDLVAQYRQVEKLAKNDNEEGKETRRIMVQRLNFEGGEVRLLSALESPRQLQEVMVDFWFNHFNVFVGKGLDRVLVENFEREAIRPYALGRFRDLLGATAHHPAMLFYLDNWLSTAPGFQPLARGNGQLAKASGLNENYARELMELHTLGVDGGYTQKDVTELARILTGWTFDPRTRDRQSLFVFDERRHDFGDKEWLGRHVAPRGLAEGEWALDVLAAHPATAHHISYELAQYFVADTPPPALVERMSRRFLETGGDIRAVLKTLFDSPEFRDPKVYDVKFKTPYQYMISSLRAGNVPVTNVRPLLALLNQLGMPLYGCQTPDGYKNTQDAWLNPDALSRRVDFAAALAAGRLPLMRPAADVELHAMGQGDQPKTADGKDLPLPVQRADPAWLTEPLDAQTLLATLGSGVSTKTRATIENADPPLRAAMVLGSPDFMRH